MNIPQQRQAGDTPIVEVPSPRPPVSPQVSASRDEVERLLDQEDETIRRGID
jgi:hypothetical protein